METAEPTQNVQVQIALSPWRIFWQRLKRRRIAMIGGAILIFLYAVALFAGFVAPCSYDRLNTDYSFHQPVWPKFSGLHLVVSRYEAQPGAFIYREVAGDTKPLHFFVRGENYK